MLSDSEVNKLLNLLRELHGKDKPRDRGTIAVWAAVLEPWDYRQVRSAAIERARENRFYPDPGELAEKLNRISGRKTGRERVSPDRWKAAEKLRELREAYNAALHRAGLPAMEEARAQGMTWEEWDELTQGVSLEECMREIGFI